MSSIQHSISSILLSLFLPGLLFSQTQDKAVIDRVVATVGGEIILLSEVQEQLAYAKQQQPTLGDEYRCVSVQNMIIQKLLVNQAKLDSVEVKDDEVETQLGARIDRLLAYFNQDQKALEDYYGQGIEQIKEQYRADMRNQILAERMQGKITEKATITPAEVREFFSKIPKDSLPYFNAEVEIREIAYKPPVNQAELAKARERIEDFRKRITERYEDFAELAKKYSDDPGSGQQGGDLGWQKRGTFVLDFEATAYKLEKNQMSPVIETEFGFHIIQLLERRGNLIHARHILIKPEVTDADLETAKVRLDSVRTAILDNNVTFSQAVKRYGDKNTQSYNNDGRVANPRSGNTFFEVADLDTDIFFAIDGLHPGEISKPADFRAPDGTRFFRIVQLVSRTKPHKADLKQDYNKIQLAALEQKKSQFTERWMVDRLRSTYLSVNDMFLSCPNIQQILGEIKM